MSKHTPGPWEYKNGSRVYWQGTEIAQVNAPGSLSVMRFNARLIAAAPELLEALTEARKYIAGQPFGLGWNVKRIDDVIFAAGGENNE